MATMWTAAGGEEYLDEGGFVLGNEMPDEDFDCSGSVSQKHSTSGPIQSEFDQSQSRGGFGSPKKKTGKQKGVLNGHSTSKQENKSKADNRPSRMSVPSVDDLRVATMRGNVKAAQDYLEQGLAVDVVLRSGWTPLMYAASFANPELVEIFLEKGADVNFHQDQFSVLMASCSSSQPQEDRVLRCAELLVEAGANVNSHDRYHMSPLIYAAREGHAKVIQYLVEKGGNLDKQDCRGWTALSWAVSKNCKLAVQKLLQLKANAYMQHCDGQTAADIAFAENFQDFLVLMKDSRAESSNDRVASPTGVVTTEVPALKKHSSSLTSTYVKQGELELFLSGLGLSTLIPLFQHHHVDFAGFLRLTDQDLQQIGVGQVGVRKKILDGVQTVHTKEWQPSSLAVQYNKRLSYTQCVALMTNISAHLKYITSSVGYVNDQLTAHPSTLDSQDGCGPRALYQLSQEAQTRLQHLGSEVTGLQTRVNKVLSKCNYEPADLVHKPRGRSKRRKVWVRRGILLCSLGGAVAVTVYFRDSVKCTLVDTFTETVTRIKQFW